VVAQFNATKNNTVPEISSWWKELKTRMDKNVKGVQDMSVRTAEQEKNKERMNYYQALSTIQQTAYNTVQDSKIMIVSEGANTMDIGRSLFPNEHPRNRLDAGTFGTMGVGFGFAIASAVVDPTLPVLLLQGDSAFGFSDMEIETIMRYKLSVVVVIINNNGITHGVDDINVTEKPLPNVLTVQARYEKVAEAFGGKGWFVTDGVEQLKKAIDEAMTWKNGGVRVVNVMISIHSGRKEQQFGWHSRKTLEAKM